MGPLQALLLARWSPKLGTISNYQTVSKGEFCEVELPLDGILRSSRGPSPEAPPQRRAHSGCSALFSASVAPPGSEQELPSIARSRDDQHPDGWTDEVQPDPRIPQ